jgi:hypothetical protein
MEINKYRNSTFMGIRPVLVVADPQLIKDMNIKDFHIFVDRNDITTGDPLNDRSLVNLFGDDWKNLRSIVSLSTVYMY